MTRSRRRLGVIILACLLGLGVLFLILAPRKSLPPQVFVSFIGYTNLPNSSRNYAVFTVVNHDKTTVQLRDISVEMEGERIFHAPIFNRNFPLKIPRLLNRGDSHMMILGDPDDPDHPSRMRLEVEFSPSGLKQKLFMVGPRRPFISLRPSGKLDELRLYLWKWGLPLVVRAPRNYSTTSEWLPTPFPQHSPAVPDQNLKVSGD
jgi:hypothetical protein